MPTKKKTEAAPVAEVKKEAAAEVKTENAAPTEAPKPAKKPATKKAPAKKAAADKKADPAKKTTAKKASAKKAEPKITVKVHFADNEYDIDQITKNVAKAYKSSVKGAVKSVEIYIKPEDGAVYYVVDSENTGKVDL